MQLAPGLASENMALNFDAHMVMASAGAHAQSSLHVCQDMIGTQACVVLDVSW